MSAPVKIVTFAALLAAVFAVASVAGAELDPAVESNTHEEDSEMQAHAEDTHAADGAAVATLPGLAVAGGDLRLELERTISSGSRAELAFRIVDADGETVSDFDLEHERRMHLIVVRRDFVNFQHLHPRQLGDGSWRAEADLEPAGAYRVFADFASGGESLTLAADLFAPGVFEPQELPEPATVADAGDGYEVTLESEPPRPGTASEARFEVSRDGRPLDSVEPYLGADGHLVALREHDQAFLHTHPEGEPGGPGPIVFRVEYPTAGRYRLFLQFKDRGEVHTAAFTQAAIGEGSDGH
jgi:hypothetical protein